MRGLNFWMAGAILFVNGGISQASLINFDSYPNGKVINNQYFASAGVQISADNFTAGHPDIAILFDTTKTNTADPDLQQPWDGGNLGAGYQHKNILIIAENQVDANNDGYIDSPDDEGGSRPAGLLKFKFKTAQTVFGLDLIDCDGTSEYGADRGYVSFWSAGVEKARVGWGAFVDPASQYYDSTVKYGDNTANHLKPITVTQLGIASFDEAQVNLGWSTAIDNVLFSTDLSAIAPEPSLVMLAALPLFAARRRRRAA